MNNLMRRSGIIAVLCFVLCAMLLVTACGGQEQPAVTTSGETTAAPDVTTKPDETTKAPDVTTAEPGDETTGAADVTYTVTVKDKDGNPVVGAKVQLCEGTTCLTPATTDANGVATLTGKAGVVYQASVTEAEGYTFDATQKYDFADGATALTIEIEKKAADTTAAPDTTAKPDDTTAEPDDTTAGDDPIEIPDEAVVITADLEKTSFDLKKGQSVSYIYNAFSNGTVVLDVTKGAKVSYVISNITTDKAGVTVEGAGSINIDTKTGNSYLITITAGADETVEYAIAIEDMGNGSKENPFYLYEGMVQHTVLVPAGTTVYYIVYDNYLLIDNPSVSVYFNGNVYAPSAAGSITGEALGVELGDVIGVVGGAADTALTIKLTGSSTECPLVVDRLGYFELEIPAGATAYFNATDRALGGVLDEVLGHVAMSTWGVPAEAPMLLTNGSNAFALTNRSFLYASYVEFFVVAAPEGITEGTAIELDNTADSFEVSLHDQKIANTWFFTYTAPSYGLFTTSVAGSPVAINGEPADVVDLSVDGVVLNRGDEILFAVQFDAAYDETLVYGVDYVSVAVIELGDVEVVVPAGESIRVSPSYMLLRGGIVLESITGDVTATCYGRPVAAPAQFSMGGLSEVVLTNSTEADVTAVLKISEVPAGTEMMNLAVVEEGSVVASALLQKITDSMWFSYTATADGVLTTNVDAVPYMLDETYPDIVDLKTEGIEVTAGQTLIFVVPVVPAEEVVDLTITVTVGSAELE